MKHQATINIEAPVLSIAKAKEQALQTLANNGDADVLQFFADLSQIKNINETVRNNKDSIKSKLTAGSAVTGIKNWFK